MTKICKPQYLAKVQLLTKEETERLLSRMSGKLPHRLERDKLSKEEALAIQMELEDEQLQEWRDMMRQLKQKEDAKALSKSNAEKKAKLASKAKDTEKTKTKTKDKVAEKAKAKTKGTEKDKNTAKPKVTEKAKATTKPKTTEKTKTPAKPTTVEKVKIEPGK